MDESNREEVIDYYENFLKNMKLVSASRICNALEFLSEGKIRTIDGAVISMRQGTDLGNAIYNVMALPFYETYKRKN